MAQAAAAAPPAGGGPALVLAALICIVAIIPIDAGVVAVGKLQTCVNDGTTPTTSLSCSQKIVVTVELENNKLYETEDLTFSVSCVNSPNDQCPCPCNYATDASCQCRDLRQDVSVKATKSPVFASYPLTWYKYFNGKPTETVIKGGSCIDQANNDGATCGFASEFGQRIPDSQGFCCDCDGWFNWGGSDGRQSRAGLNCGWFNFEYSAHCLRLNSSLWYQAWIIGEYVMQFHIDFNVTYTTTTPVPNVTHPGEPASATTSTWERLRLTPSEPFKRDSAQKLSAKLLGDLESYQQYPQVAGRYLFIPQYDGQIKSDAYSTYLDQWMVVPDSMVTATGLECDKIGVSYSGFRNSQPNGCEVPRGSCLKNQAYDVYQADVARVAAGLTPQYLIGRYGGGVSAQQFGDGWTNTTWMNYYLNLPLPGIRTSLVTLTVAADDVALTVNRSPAEILSVQVCTYANASCGGFEAMTSRGYLQVTVRNSGYVAADYTVTVSNCSTGVAPVVAQSAGIQAQSNRLFQFELAMQSAAGGNNSCTVAVMDQLGASAASQPFSFYANASSEVGSPPDVDESDIGSPDDDGGSGSGDWCKQVCPNVMNLKCAVDKGCYGRLAKGLGAVAAPAAAVSALLVAWKTGHLSTIIRVVSFLFSCCCGRPQQAAAPGSAPATDQAAAPDKQKQGARRARANSLTSSSGDEGSGSGSDDGRGGGGGGRRIRAVQAGAAGWKALRVAKVASEPPEVRAAAAAAARGLLPSLRSLVSNPLAPGGDEEAAGSPLPTRVSAPQSPAWLSPPPPEPLSPALGMMGSPHGTPLAAFPGSSPFAGYFQQQSMGGMPGTPLAPAGSPFSAPGVGAGPPFAPPGAAASLEQQLRQAQQQRQLMQQLERVRQLQQLQQAQQAQQQAQQALQLSQSFGGGHRGGAAAAAAAAAAAELQVADRTASAPALYLAQFSRQASMNAAAAAQQHTGMPSAAQAAFAASLLGAAPLPPLPQQQLSGAPPAAPHGTLAAAAAAWRQEQMRALGVPSPEAQQPQQQLQQGVGGAAAQPRSRFAPPGA